MQEISNSLAFGRTLPLANRGLRTQRGLLSGVGATLSLLGQAIAAIRRNGGTLIGVPDNFAGAYTDSTGTTPVTAVGDIIGKLNSQTNSNHATQPTTASKPVVTRVPKRTKGPVNQLSWSGDFSNAVWDTFAPAFTRTLDASAGPNGDAAWRITATATLGVPVRQQVATATSVTLTVAYKAGTFNPNGWAVRNTTTSTNLASNATFVGLPNGWTLLSLVVTSGITIGNTLSLYFGAAGGIAEGLYWFLHRGALFTGAYTAQQIIDNGGIPLTTTQPLPNVLEWTNAISFDGSNDFLQFPVSQIGTAETLIWVGYMTGGAGTTRAALVRRDDTAKTGMMIYADAANTYQVSVGNGLGFVAVPFNAAATLNQPIVLSALGNATARTLTTYRNGQLQAIATTVDPVASVAQLASIGGLNSVFPAPCITGYCVRIPGLVSDADRVTIERALGAIFGMTL